MHYVFAACTIFAFGNKFDLISFDLKSRLKSQRTMLCRWRALTQAVQAELLSCQTQLDQLSTDCMEVCPIHARQTAAANATTPCAVLALCDYSDKEVLLARSVLKKTGKVLSYRVLGQELIPVYRQSVRRWLGQPHGGRLLPLLSVRPAVTSEAFTRWL